MFFITLAVCLYAYFSYYGQDNIAVYIYLDVLENREDNIR